MNIAQTIAAVTLGVADLARARRFYVEGFGWRPVFEADEVVFFQMNGLILALFDRAVMEKESGRGLDGAGSVAVAHNVRAREDVDGVLAAAEAAGGRILTPASDRHWGGRSGYFADPDGHAWEVAWNPNWTIAEDGSVRIGG